MNPKVLFAKEQEPKVKAFLDNLEPVDLILSHIPPFGILEKVTNKFAPASYQGKNAGSIDLLNYIQNNNLRYIICSHIYEAEGSQMYKDSTIINLGIGKSITIDL